MKLGKHVDEFIEEMEGPATPEMGNVVYARWFFLLARLPAFMQMQFEPWIQQYKLFCTFEGKRYRCTGASRMGDVWLAKDFERRQGYDLRVDLVKCTHWSGTP